LPAIAVGQAVMLYLTGPYRWQASSHRDRESVGAPVIARLAADMHAAIITDFSSAVYAVVITDFSGPMDPMVIAYFACPMNPMIITRFGVGAVAS